MKNYIIGTNNKFYYYFNDNNADNVFNGPLLVEFCKFLQQALVFTSKKTAEEKIKFIIETDNEINYYDINRNKYIKPGDFITGEGNRKFEINDFKVFIIEYLVREAP